MHITLETDYAIRIVDYLAKTQDRADAKTISENTSVPQTFAVKILRKLGGSGIVRSYKGKKGGYELTEDSADISVYDVVSTMEGTYCFSRCLNGHYNCNRGKNELPCTYQTAFARISDMVCTELKKLKFADLKNIT